MQARDAHNYRPWLDGVRAIAIALVLVEHTGVFGQLHLRLGGTGVGVFFALSGYLITGLLFAEMDRTGDIALRRFYIRRLARLMPALALVVLIGDLFFWWFGAHEELKNSLFALTYLTNYGTIFNGTHLPGYGHTWSLAVEEHFYLIWPAFLLLLSRRFSLRGILICTLAICAAVFLWRVLLSNLITNMRVLYVGSVERADALLYGCAGAMLLRMGWRPHRALFYLGVAGISVYAAGWSDWAPLNSALIGICSTFVVMCLDHCKMIEKRWLSYGPMVWLGIMSYGMYLWHAVMFQIAERFGYTAGQASWVVLPLSGLIAYCSYRWFETPIRNYVRSRERDPRSSPSMVHERVARSEG